MWVLGFWQDLRDAAQAIELFSRAYAAVASIKRQEAEKDEEEDSEVDQLKQEVAKLKAEVRSLKKKKKVVKRNGK